MLASYISAVLCSLIASFIDELSLTVQCRPCSFGEALHIIIAVYHYNRISLYTTKLTVTTPGLLSYIVTVTVIYSCNKSLPKATSSSVLYV